MKLSHLDLTTNLPPGADSLAERSWVECTHGRQVPVQWGMDKKLSWAYMSVVEYRTQHWIRTRATFGITLHLASWLVYATGNLTASACEVRYCCLHLVSVTVFCLNANHTGGPHHAGGPRKRITWVVFCLGAEIQTFAPTRSYIS